MGTGDAAGGGPAPDDEDMFRLHFLALECVIDRAISVEMRFALKKCVFAQRQVKLLGMVAGAGWIEPEEAKVQGILAWPRLARRDDVESFMATMVPAPALVAPLRAPQSAAAGHRVLGAARPVQGDQDAL